MSKHDSKSDPKLSKNDKAKATNPCKPTTFTLTFNSTYSDNSKKSVSVNFTTTPVDISCSLPSKAAYDAAVIDLYAKWNGIQRNLAKKYKAAGKVTPRLTGRTTNLTSSASNCSSGPCIMCYGSKDSCQATWGTCIQCPCNTSCWEII